MVPASMCPRVRVYISDSSSGLWDIRCPTLTPRLSTRVPSLLHMILPWVWPTGSSETSDDLGGSMRFARIVFMVAGIWGVVVLAPLYWLVDLTGHRHAPPTDYPQFFYGFLSVAMAWQIAFLVI